LKNLSLGHWFLLVSTEFELEGSGTGNRPCHDVSQWTPRVVGELSVPSQKREQSSHRLPPCVLGRGWDSRKLLSALVVGYVRAPMCSHWHSIPATWPWPEAFHFESSWQICVWPYRHREFQALFRTNAGLRDRISFKNFRVALRWTKTFFHAYMTCIVENWNKTGIFILCVRWQRAADGSECTNGYQSLWHKNLFQPIIVKDRVYISFIQSFNISLCNQKSRLTYTSSSKWTGNLLHVKYSKAT